MKKVGEIMKDAGFNQGSNTATQEAFIKYLIKQAYGVEVQTPTEKQNELITGQQLSFNFEQSKKVS
jgi:hypothetical protein